MASSIFGGSQWQLLAIRGQRVCAVKHVPSNRQSIKILASISGSMRTVPPMKVHRSNMHCPPPRTISSSPWRIHASLITSFIVHYPNHAARCRASAANEYSLLPDARPTALDIDLEQ